MSWELAVLVVDAGLSLAGLWRAAVHQNWDGNLCKRKDEKFPYAYLCALDMTMEFHRFEASYQLCNKGWKTLLVIW